MSETKIKINLIKIVFLGDYQVGKTCLINAFMDEEFRSDTMSTIGIDKIDTRIKMKNGEEKKLILWDTGGQERYRSISLKTVIVSHAVGILFDLTNRMTFNNVIYWLKDIKEIKDCPIALFGCKSDLKEERKIGKEEGEKIAKDNNIFYFETSAKENINIKESIKNVCKLYI